MNGLVASEVRVHYGGVAALAGVSLRVDAGTVRGLIGPNGAGKTSFLNAVTGVVRPDSGTIALGNVRLDRLPTHRIARAGVARTYQNIRLFAALSVANNLRAGAFRRGRTITADEMRSLLARTSLGSVSPAQRAGSLAYGDQRRLEIARALAGEPVVLLLDEPTAGMNPSETKELGVLIRAVADSGTAVLLVEHDMSLVNAVCDCVTVLNFGVAIADGAPADIARDPAVVEAYLGVPAVG